MVPSTLLRRCVLAAGAFSAVALIAHAAHALGLMSWLANDDFFDTYVYLALEAVGALVCAARALFVRRERLAWCAMSVGLIAWTAGDVLVDFVWAGNPPFPSVADLLFLIYYPAAYVALVLLVRARFKALPLDVWLDGVVVGLSLAAVAAALVLKPIVEATSGNSATVATTLAYPVGDLILLVFVAAVTTMTGFRPGRAIAMIGAGLLVTGFADSVYTYLVSTSAYRSGGILDTLWPAGMLLIGFAGWGSAPRAERRRAATLPIFIGSAVCSLLALGLLIIDHYNRLTPLALWLAAAAVLVGVLRAGLRFAGKVRALRQAETEATTDGLTGLGNRRLLMSDLEAALDSDGGLERGALVLYDLNGFKHYNDVFGHPAGDALLARLGHALGAAVEGKGRAYRLGGDEFCVLFDRDVADDEQALADASRALSEDGDGFEVSSASGLVTLPTEARTTTRALQIADARMYAQKGSRRRSAQHQASDVLLQTLREQEPDLHEHMTEVAERSVALARHLKLGAEAIDEVGRAAQLHDVGKIAIPAEILHKPGPLDEREWEFMHQHTVIGERILAAAPALRPVARLVRASHERWDGTGYPDGLAGEDIPIGARIVALCDAFHAMTSDRPYRRGMTNTEALGEIKRGAGTQFDPVVVDAFIELFLAESRQSRFKHADRALV
jgi:two-component system, cell cycle response regulator